MFIRSLSIPAHYIKFNKHFYCTVNKQHAEIYTVRVESSIDFHLYLKSSVPFTELFWETQGELYCLYSKTHYFCKAGSQVPARCYNAFIIYLYPIFLGLTRNWSILLKCHMSSVCLAKDTLRTVNLKSYLILFTKKTLFLFINIYDIHAHVLTLY